MVLLIDNYDSFSYNLYQLVGELAEDVKVIRNDEMNTQEIKQLQPSHIILSPGPGKPKDAGICETVVQELGDTVPILGVWLGHQAICEVHGLEVTYAKHLMHGKQSLIEVDQSSRLFAGLEKNIKVARYHSLIAKEQKAAEELIVTAKSAEGEIMAVEHKEKAIFGLQFHPESILTPDGKKMIENFLAVK